MSTFNSRRFLFAPVLAALLLLPAVRPAPLGSELASQFEVPFVKVFEPSKTDAQNWKPEDDKSRMNFLSFGGVGVLIAEKTGRPWGALQKNVSVDLDRYPLLQINVISATQAWYLILNGPQFKDGFVRLIETRQTGPFVFDIPKLAKLKGVQKFDVKLGVSDAAAPFLVNQKVSFSKIAFVARPPSPEPAAKTEALPSGRRKTAAPDGNSLFVFNSDLKDADLWQEAAKDGPIEVSFSVRDGLGTVVGKMEDRNYAAARKEVTVDLNAYPTLEINVVSCSKSWYIVLSNPGLPQGYIRLTETKAPGTFQFDVPARTRLSGVQKLEIQLGVSSPAAKFVKGESMTFDVLRFKGK